MEKIKVKIQTTNPKNITDFFTLYRDLQDELKTRDVVINKKIRIAILSSFTTKGLKEILFVKCGELGVFPDVYIGNYNQYSQEILDDSSDLYIFKPDLVIIFIDVRTLLGDYYFLPYSISDNDRKKWVEKKINELNLLIKKIKSKLPCKILLHNFEVPHYSPLGILESKQEFGFLESIEKINIELRNKYKDDYQVHIFDFNNFSSILGKRNVLEHKMYYLADLKVNLQYLPDLCESYLAYIKPAASCIKKCIVLDLDNTMWGGIIGEDGLGGIKIGHNPEGRPFLEFQKNLLSLFNRGIILAVNSKNNLNDVLKVFQEHPDMVLRENHFAAMRVNWNDKVSNLKSIAEEINIGTNSLVFFDDDKLNREMVKSEMPEVLVVDLPEDPALYTKTLQEMNDFNSFELTEEDKIKGKMYADQRRRNEFKENATDITSYLRGLEMEVEIEEINDFNISRLSQLTQKTNQFNMTTRRYSVEDLKKFQTKGDLIISLRLKDKFGDNGITGMAIVQKGIDCWFIDTFLLSCRVIGRKVEDVMFGHILNQARENGISKIEAQFVPTEKNQPAKDFYDKKGFLPLGKNGEVENFIYEVNGNYILPDYIKLSLKKSIF